ncbi:MAG: choice-of-anchor D domain-containing protein [Gammaproteobacteria bacterium]|nr:choice-of-anchor D domain-containing protein [Gammaproteobacteria bacterium]
MNAVRMSAAVVTSSTTKRGPYAYFTNRDNNTVSVVDYSDLGAVKAEPLSLDAGQIPQGIAISPSGGYIYVGTGDGKIVIIRAHDRHRIGEVTLEAKPASLLVSRDGTRLYAVVEGGKSIIVIDTAARSAIKTIALADVSDRLAIHLDGTRLYSLSHVSGKVYVIDVASGDVVKSHALIEQGAPEDIALDASGERLYITLGHLTTTSLAVLDTATNEISFPEISFEGLPQALAVNPAAQQLFVTTELPQAPSCAEIFGKVYIVDTTDLKLTSTLDVKGVAADIVVTKAGWLFGMNKQTNHLEVLDKNGQLLNRLAVMGLGPLVSSPELASIITPSAKQLDFGEVPSGQPAARTLTITNTGSLPLTVSGVRIEVSSTPANIPVATATNSSGFAVAEDTCTNKTLQPDGQCAITLSYAPVSTGQSGALVHIDSDSTLLSAPVAVTARGVSGAEEALPSSASGNSGGGGGSWGPISLMFAVLWALVRRGRQRL